MIRAKNYYLQVVQRILWTLSGLGVYFNRASSLVKEIGCMR